MSETAPLLYDIHLTAANNSLRYALGRRGSRPLLIIGLNPSTANQYTRDQTLTRVEHFCRRRANGLIMCNLYPQRATDPDDLPKKADLNLIHQNTDHILNLAQKIQNPEIWAAWGDPIDKRSYLTESMNHLHTALSRLAPRWIQSGSTTVKGHPRHPSRLAYKNRFSAFDIGAYLAGLNQRS
jgi:hypothetical protein